MQALELERELTFPFCADWEFDAGVSLLSIYFLSFLFWILIGLKNERLQDWINK